MPHSSCLACCDPTGNSRGVDMYRAAVLQILCAQLNTVTQALCNESGEPIIVRSVFDANGENPEITAWNMDGTPYSGAIVACGA